MDIRRRFLIPKAEAINLPEGGYTVELNENWRLSTSINNPDSSLYDGVYESFSNYNVNSGTATMTITLNNLDSFTLYIRSYAEANYDYVMVSQLDVEITGSTSYLYDAAVKAHTRTTQNSGTDIYSYIPVRYENIGGGEHTITIVYRKDEGGNSYDDRGYVLIDKNITVFDENGDSPGGSDTPVDEFNIDNYLTIEALENGLTASLSANNCEYCIDGSNEWVSLSAGVATPSINTGQTISFRATGLIPSSTVGIGQFTISKSCNLKGNCNSLLFGDNAATNYSLSGYNYAYYKLFYNCTTIKEISRDFLPARALSNNCYYYMFYGCTNLTQAPDLPAQSLAGSCYYYMFYNCKALTKAPDLPAQTLQTYCYACMFYNCSELINAPIIAATTLATHCCYYMFYNCTSLVTSPDLLAETLTSYCYYSMFSGCSSMLYIKMLALDVSASSCMSNWVKKVEKQGGVFTKHINATWTTSGDSGVPKKWTIQYYNPQTGEITT